MNKFHWALIIITVINAFITIDKDCDEKDYPFASVVSTILSSAFIILLIVLSSIK